MIAKTANMTGTENELKDAKVTLKETEASLEHLENMLENTAVPLKQMRDALKSLTASLKSLETSPKVSETLTEVTKIFPGNPAAGQFFTELSWRCTDGKTPHSEAEIGQSEAHIRHI
jgi:chromosome segregation ATPase